MPTITARNTLTAMWPLIYNARNRLLSEAEALEIKRLSEILQRGIPGKEAYNEAVDDLCMSLYSSGIFEGNSGSADKLSQKIDALRQTLDTPEEN